MEVEEEKMPERPSDCWSCKSSEAMTPLYAGTEFFVSKVVLENLQARFGPTGTVARVSHKRYGWELLLLLLGPERLQMMNGLHRIRVVTMSKKMVSTADILYLVLQHSRQIYNSPAIAADSRVQERWKFADYCGAMLSHLRQASRTDVQPSGCSRKLGKRLSRKAASISHQLAVQRSSRSTRKRSPKARKSSDDVDDSSSSEDNSTQTKSFLHQSVSNNSAVSEESLRTMMNSTTLKKEVADIMRIAQSLSEERIHFETFVDADDDFVVIHLDGRDLHLSLAQVKEFCTKRWSIEGNVSGWRCRHCSWVCSEEKGMCWHVAKEHFFDTMGVEEGCSDNAEVDTPDRKPVTANQEAPGKPSPEREVSVIEIQDSSDDEEVKIESSDLISSGAVSPASDLSVDA